MVCRVACIQRPNEGGLGMPDVSSHKYASRLSFLRRSLTEEPLFEQSVKAAFPSLKVSSIPTDAYQKRRGETEFQAECRSALRALVASNNEKGLAVPRNALYRELVGGRASDPLIKQQGLSKEQVRNMWSWAPGADYLSNSEFSLTWRLARNALHVNKILYKMNRAELPYCTRCNSETDETTVHAFVHCEKLRPLWDYVHEVIMRMEPRTVFLSLDAGYICGNEVPKWSRTKQEVFRTLLAVARMVIWQTRLKELYDGESFTPEQLILCFKHQLRVKIRCQRKSLDPPTFSKRWKDAVSLICVRENGKYDVLF